MILTDREIKIALKEGAIVIDPLPDLAVAVSSTTIDLTLGDTFKEWDPIGGMPVQPGADDYDYTKLVRLQKTHQGPFTLAPHSFVLGWTREKVSIPYISRLAARVEGKSSLARLGIGLHVTAPTIHAGFTGLIQLEIFNLGPFKVALSPGMRVCQLVFEQTTGTPEQGYSGMFLDQTKDGPI